MIQKVMALKGQINMTEKEYSLRELQKEMHETAKLKGWHETEREIPELLCLIHSEVSEALECYRNNEMNTTIRYEDGKPEGFNTECADIAIRLMDMCEYLNIDLYSEIMRKWRYNQTRTYKHGGKMC